MSYHFFTWNVNGYSQDIHQWLKQHLEENGPDLVFLTETKRTEADLKLFFDQLTDYSYIINSHIPHRWHGVAMLIKKPHQFKEFSVEMGIAVRDDNKSSEASKGRVILIQLNSQINVIGSYTPNGGKYFDYRVKIWDPAFTKLLNVVKQSGPTVWLGDLNVAPTNLDVSDPIGMAGWAGFTPQERANFRHFEHDWADPWRIQHPTLREYTWVGSVRRPNYGMRLDYILISKNLLPYIKESYVIQDSSSDTDHLPTVLWIGNQ